MTDQPVGGDTAGNPPSQPAPAQSGAQSAPSQPKPSASAEANQAPKPKIGDSRPAPVVPNQQGGTESKDGNRSGGGGRNRNRRGRGRGGNGGGNNGSNNGGNRGGRQGKGDAKAKDGGSKDGNSNNANANNGGNRSNTNGGGGNGEGGTKKRRRRGGRRRGGGGGGGDNRPVEALTGAAVELDEAQLEARKGRERNGKPVGRYLMVVSRRENATQIAVLEGRALIEHSVSRPSDDVAQIHGNIYLGKVQNVLPGMEAAFVDISTPKNAVLYRGDVQLSDADKKKGSHPRIEQLLKPRQTIICQVTKNPIAHKGARLTQEVSLPGRFVVLVPNSDTYGISKRLPDKERKRLRSILDRVRPKGHGLIVRTAAENVTAAEIENDVARLAEQWKSIEELASKTKKASLLYREPDLSLRMIREEFNKDYRGVVIDDRELYEQVKEYVSSITPALADRVQFHDPATEKLSLFEKHHVAEQLRKAVDKKVWLKSGGSLIIEGTEALTVIDVNTGKNVGKSSLEETVFRNNLEAAEEVARQLRLRDIGGIIVIDFVDMEKKSNREEVQRVFREALSRDKTRTQAYDISDLGLVEMTRKRIGEGLIESMSHICEDCDGGGFKLDEELLNY